MELFEKYQIIKACIRYNEILKLNTSNHELADSVVAYKTVIGKKSDAHVNKKPSRFTNRLT